ATPRVRLGRVANDLEIIACNAEQPTTLSYASPGTWSRSRKPIEWRTEDRALVLLVPGPPKWLDVVLAAIVFAAELATIATALAIIWQQHSEWETCAVVGAVLAVAA